MDYIYENLGEDHFQALCQALLVREFPNVQCFPLRQRDGGRDAISTTYPRGAKSVAVFQVKFSRKPLAVQDPHKWLIAVLEGELPKIKKLIPAGVAGYYLITNVPGTSHLDAGSIDKCQKLLEETLNVPAFCWWRDDINRRMDSAFDLKWTYPQILSGGDMLRIVIEQGLSEDAQRRSLALRAFVRAQYEEDKEVRFKQVELQRDLLSLFVDVPLGYKCGLSDVLKYQLYSHVEQSESQEESYLGNAVSFFLKPSAKALVSQVVLEGAPGQGKSTITQYLCQVYRMQLLEENSEYRRLPPEHTPTSRCIPIKVDLRDLALWLNKKDPFSSEETADPPKGWIKSLEGFLAALIRHKSGGHDFTVTDLHAVARLSSILLVLDGLDEVADIPRRREVIGEVTIGSARLREASATLQLIVTSRPTAFGPTLTFNEQRFPHYELRSLSRPLITEYADKWIFARRLKPDDAGNVRKILRVKIEQRHLRELTRNPMQLTILLSLIHTRGVSLPEKRTALYDGYVELFLNRESEKSEIVREHRDLLVDLHRYLAWVLHSEAEARKKRGSLSASRLERLLKAYLKQEDRADTSVTDLFTGMVERIVFLISRVEGTFEFEVQPLREYFAAKFLYDTAPHSPPGRERKGTKPDRFDGIAQNPYWLNVSRFFAGCFSKGELACLVDRLEALAEKDRPNFSNRHRRLAVFLLRDWVFAQDQKSTKRAINMALGGGALSHPLKRRRPLTISDEEFVLPVGCGRDEVIEVALRIIRDSPIDDVGLEAARVLAANASTDIVDGLWRLEFEKARGADITKWIRYGLQMGSLGRVNAEELICKFSEAPLTPEQSRYLVMAGQHTVIEQSNASSETLVNGALEGTVTMFKDGRHLIDRFLRTVNPMYYVRSYMGDISRQEQNGPPLAPPTNDVLARCAEFVARAEQLPDSASVAWVASLRPWLDLTENLARLWGNRPILYQFALLSSWIRSGERPTEAGTDLFDASVPLCVRARDARFRPNNVTWWKGQLLAAKRPDDALFAALLMSDLAGIKTFSKLLELFEERLTGLGPKEWRVFESTLQMPTFFRGRRSEKISALELPEHLHERAILSLARRMDVEGERALYLKYLTEYDGEDQAVCSFCLRVALSLVDSREDLWGHILGLLRKTGMQRGSFDPYHLYFGKRAISHAMPLPVAREIAGNPNKFPRPWVFVAIDRCELDLASTMKPVATIAEEEGWFERA